MAHLLERLEPARRRLNDAAGAEKRLGNNRRRLPGCLGVQKLEARLQAGELAAWEGLVERTSIAVRRNDRVCATRQMSMSRVPAGECHRACRIG